MSGRSFFRRRTREGVAPRLVGSPMVVGATALGVGTTAVDARGALLIVFAAALSFVLGG